MKSDCARCSQLGEGIMCNVCASSDIYDAKPNHAIQQIKQERLHLAIQLEDLVKEPGSRVHLGTTVRELILTLKE